MQYSCCTLNQLYFFWYKFWVFPWLYTINRTIFTIMMVTANLFLIWWIEQFLIECRKTKTKVITLTNHKKTQTIQWTNQNSKLLHVADTKREKMCVSKSQLVLVLLLIRWSGESFLNQSGGVVSTIPITTRYSNKNHSILQYYKSNNGAQDNILTSSNLLSMNSLHTLLWHMVSAMPPPPSKANDLWCW